MTPKAAGGLQGRIVLIVGAGQTPGATAGNGRATAITFAREGARLVLVDRDLCRAEETADASDATSTPPHPPPPRS